MNRAVVVLLAAVALFAAPLSAQRVQRRVYLSARDASGAPIHNLTGTDFVLAENGVARQILRATRANGPMRIALVVDSSDAVSALINPFRAGLNVFLDQLRGGHEITLITTGGQIRIRQPLTTDRQTLKATAGLFAADGGANSVLETMMEVERRFLNGAPGQWPVLVIVTTDNEVAPWVSNDRFNRFVTDFLARGGTAHAIVVHGSIRTSGLITEAVANVVERTGGFYELMAIANLLPDKMKALAEHIDANYQAMSDWYEVEYLSDGRAQSARIEAGTRREDVRLQMSIRRPF